jgi:hypothetical protein
MAERTSRASIRVLDDGWPRFSSPGAGSVFTHPDHLLNAPDLTAAEKRAVLASWISDARAVVDAPTLRQLDSGAIVDIDELLRALKALDNLSDAPTDGAATLNHMRSARSAAALIQLRSRHSRRVTTDDDDDPPPRPAAAMPIPVSLLAA